MSRTISTRLAIEGENEYKQAIKNCSDRMQLLRSELAKSEAEFGKNKTSVEGLTAKSKLLTEQIDVQKDKVSAIKDQLAKAAETYGETSDQAQKYQKELNYAEASLAKMEKALKDNNQELSNMQNKAKLAGEAMQTAGGQIEKFGGNIESIGNKAVVASAAIVALGTASVDAWKDMDEGYDTIIKKTGATGEAYESLKESADKVFTTLPVEISDTGNAIGEINTRFGATGETLESLTSDFLKFAEINDSDVTQSVANASKIINAWNMDASHTGELLGMITSKSQSTGVSVDKLMDSVVENNATFKEMGLGLEESINLVAEFERNGVSASTALAALKRAAANAAQDGLTLRDAMQSTIDTIKNAEDSTTALNAASELFGTRGAVEMSTAIKEGRIDLNNLSDDMQKYSGVVSETFESTLDPIDDMKVTINQTKATLAEFGGEILSSAQPMVSELNEGIKHLSEWFGNLTEEEKKNVVKTTALIAAAGPLLSIFGKLTTGIGKTVTAGGKFIDWLGKLKGSLGNAEGAVGNLVTSLTSSGAAGLIGGATIAFGTVYALANDSKWKENAMIESFSSLADSMEEFQQKVNESAGVLQNFNAESYYTSEQIEGIENSISLCKDKILDISEKAASESRALTDAEYAEVERLIGMIDTYMDKKLDAYENQQKVVEAMISRETDMTDEQAAAYIKSAEDSYNQVLNLAAAHRTDMYAEAEKQKEAGTLTEAQYQSMLDQADSYYNQIEERSRQHYADSIAEVSDLYYEQHLAGTEYYERLIELSEKVKQQNSALNKARSEGDWQTSQQIKSDLQQTQYELQKMYESSDAQILGSWMSMAATAEVYGGDLSEESKNTSDKILDSFDSLSNEGKKSFEDLMDGALEGIRSKASKLYDAAANIGSTIIGKFRSIFDSHSPSRVMKKFFRDDVMGGGQIGMQQGGKVLAEEAEKQAQESIKAMQTAIESANLSSASFNIGQPRISPVLTNKIIEADNAIVSSIYTPMVSSSASTPHSAANNGEEIYVDVHIGTLNNNRSQDIDALGQQIGIAIRNSRRAVGKK